MGLSKKAVSAMLFIEVQLFRYIFACFLYDFDFLRLLDEKINLFYQILIFISIFIIYAVDFFVFLCYNYYE